MHRIRSLPLIMGLLVSALGRAAIVQADSDSADFHELVEEVWEFDLREDPVNATRVGDHRYNDRLARISVADEERRHQAMERFLERLEEIDEESLSPADRVDYQIFRRGLRDRLAEYRFQTHLMPISNRSGFHIEFPELRRHAPLQRESDYEDYIARLTGLAELVEGHVELLQSGLRVGLTQPAVIMERYREPIEAHIVDDPEESLLYEPLRSFPPGVPEEARERLRASAREAIAGSVVPGYRKFLQFMEEVYVPNCRATIGASGLPDGREFYRYRVRRFTTLDNATPEQIHARGLAEVARIRAEMDAIIEKVGFQGDFSAFTEHLRTDPVFYAAHDEELLSRAARVLKEMDGKLPTLFGRLPRMTYGLKPVPDYIAPATTAAYYQRPAGDGSKAGFFFLNTYNLPSRPLYSLEALALHEAVPGHHLQLALQQELPGLPKFRKFSGFTAFIEGWALYAERLGLEVGFYQDPYSDFGRLTMEIWRACRLVVDTGMHYFGWTRRQAIDFMKDNSAMSLHNIEAEVDRYIGWPGQALAYKTGELKIRELRSRAEEQLGASFDVRRFHDVVLGSGAVPLDVLETNVVNWIAENDSGTAPTSD